MHFDDCSFLSWFSPQKTRKVRPPSAARLTSLFGIDPVPRRFSLFRSLRQIERDLKFLFRFGRNSDALKELSHAEMNPKIARL